MEKANVNKYLCTLSHFVWKTEKRFRDEKQFITFFWYFIKVRN